MSKYRIELGHTENSVFAIGDKATAISAGQPGNADMEAAIAELDKLIALLASYRAEIPDNKAIQRSAKKAREVSEELNSQEPSPTRIRRLLEGICEGVTGIDALVDIVSKLQALIAHLF